MATKTINWTTCDPLDCASAIPTTAYICVPASLVVEEVSTANAFITAEITQAVCNSCTDRWTYTLSYDDSQISSGFVLSQANIKTVLCSNCYTDFVLSNVVDASCSILETCLGVTFVSTDAEFSAALTDENDTICVTGPFTLTASYIVEKSFHILAGGVIETDGNVLTINASFTAGEYQIFDTSTGEILFGPGAIEKVLLEWFGATGDGVTDDTTSVQLAINAAVANSPTYFPIAPLGGKNYGITLVNVPGRTTVDFSMGRTSGGKVTGLAAGIMFQCPPAYSENQITFRGGGVIDGNNVATTLINTGFASGLVIDGISFMYATNAGTGIDHTGGGIINRISNCRFSGDFGTPIKIGGLSLKVDIDNCMLNCKGSSLILTDSTWVGDNLRITNCVLDPLNGVDTIKINRLDNATPTLHFVISDCRFDGGVSSAHINVGQYCYGNIENCGLSGGSGFPGMVINGDEVTVSNNYLGNAGITLGADSRFCIINPQKWGGFSPHFTDSGTLNIIDPYDGGVVLRKGTTGQRPTLLATGMTGYPYIDTTLGRTIWWNDSAWLDLLPAPTTWVPTVSASGAMTVSGLTISLAEYFVWGNQTFFNLCILFTLGGVADTKVYVTLPNTAVTMGIQASFPANSANNSVAVPGSGWRVDSTDLTRLIVFLPGVINWTLGAGASISIQGRYTKA